MITTTLISSCHCKTLVPFCLQKEKTSKHIFKTNSKLLQYLTEKQIMPSKTWAISWYIMFFSHCLFWLKNWERESFLYYFSVLQSFELFMQDSHPSLYSTKTYLLHSFLIHFGSVQKMLTALFKIVWNTQKTRWTFFLSSTQARYFLILKRIWWR